MASDISEEKANDNDDGDDVNNALKITNADKIVVSGPSAIRNQYEALGVENYYVLHGDHYKNPHEMKIRAALDKLLFRSNNEWISQIDFSNILDLCCGSGEMTMYLREYLTAYHPKEQIKIHGLDPFTVNAYLKRTGMSAFKYGFEDIQNGILWEILESETYSLIVCSYALHLCDASRLSSVCYCLSMVGHRLLIITPHKRPNIDASMGWKLLFEGVDQKVRIRLYRSIYFMDK